MKYRSRIPIISFGAMILLSLCVNCGSVRTTSNNTTSYQARSLASVLNPIGIVKSARRLVSSGVHMFRDRLQEGAKVAQLLNGDMNDGVAHLVTKMINEQPFLSKMSEDNVEVPRDGMLGGIFRFMGMDSRTVGTIVINVLIFIAEMITSSMLGKDSNELVDARMIKENLIDWLIKGQNEKVDKILKDARDSALPENIIATLQQKTGTQTACIQLLICKTSPFIWSFQKTIDEQLGNGTGLNESSARNLLSVNLWDSLYQVFPDKKRFVTFGDGCEKRFPDCKLLKFHKNNSP